MLILLLQFLTLFIASTEQMAGLPKISNHPLVSLMASASQRLLGRPKLKKDPVTPEMFKALRSVALCLIGYAVFFFFFFSFSELSQIKPCDVKFFPSYAFIFLESSKTDQFRDRAWIVIARSDLLTCPVKALEAHVSAAQINLSKDLPARRSSGTRNSSSKNIP